MAVYYSKDQTRAVIGSCTPKNGDKYNLAHPTMLVRTINKSNHMYVLYVVYVMY